ncbi:MAG: hypothetical protein K8H88_21070, partial [Sandaracinaceae bacterium]|nr:hypothetical protein [Sandaracinaceae bacterium]
MKGWLARVLRLLAMSIAAWLALRGLAYWHARDGEALFDGDADLQVSMSRGVDRWVDAPLDRADFPTGNARFDGEWLLVTRMMAAIGYAQLAIEHPELQGEMRPRVARCLDALLDPRSRAFDAEAWGHDALDDLGSDRAHLAFLGYVSLALALAEEIDPETRHAEVADRIAAHLIRLYARSPTGLLETYPGEVYPTDN